jgi:hypothetical protein
MAVVARRVSMRITGHWTPAIRRESKRSINRLPGSFDVAPAGALAVGRFRGRRIASTNLMAIREKA